EGMHPGFAGDRCHSHGRLQVPGGNGHAEIDASTAADGPVDVRRFEQVSDHHLGAGVPQGHRAIVLAVDHRANGKPPVEEQTGHASPDRPDLTSCPGYEYRSVILHATYLLDLFISHLSFKRRDRVDHFMCGHDGTRVVWDIDDESGVHLF